MPRCWLLLLVVLALFVHVAVAQLAIYVQHEEQFYLVQAADGIRPVIKIGDKLKTLRSSVYRVVEAKDYLPFTVLVDEESVTDYSQGDLNHELRVRCRLWSPYTLKDVFVLFIFKDARGQDSLFFFEVGELPAREPRPLFVGVPITRDAFSAGGSKYRVHVFSRGGELVTNKLGVGTPHSLLNRMVRRKIAGVSEAPCRPFVGPDPVYPKALLKQRIPGKALVGFKVSASGEVSEPMVLEATKAEFGAAALEAIEHWRFLPKVKQGRAVESKARMPFAFTPGTVNPGP